ncbi:hypothetical protein JAAARDRAFT_196194 [Jaapia argillacea MUCL 33604]|uniref:TMEM205-like domain-containing protein n=1 Tax=Jaapia argillacea MUCL 33604 TaxID=933084 RepID=A0A067PWS4_9AGAM|nr:hypothetical protein JAAARDRAFT_196194 [Jaapia argillacea MUCL 33604]
MPRTEFTSATFKSLFSVNGLYLVLYSWVFGMAVWVTFFGGIIALKTLPRHQFGTLQHRTFPIYFLLSLSLTSVLVGLWTWKHSDIWTGGLKVGKWGGGWVVGRVGMDGDLVQFWTLVGVCVCMAVNQFVVGPLTSRTMFQRHRLEKEEGKGYDEVGVSKEMKALNAKFSGLHGVSSLLNLGAVIALGFHGLWIGEYGVKGY